MHTKTPWQLVRDDNREEYRILAKPEHEGAVGMHELATINFGFTEPFESQTHANAKLMAAAPDLLAVCKSLRGLLEKEGIDWQTRYGFESYWPNQKKLDQLDAAISKATT